MEFTDGECLMYLGCLHEKKNVSEVAETFYPDKQNSVRSAISRNDAVDELVGSGYLSKKKNGSWKYLAAEEKLGEFVVSMLEENYTRDPAPRIDRQDFDAIQEIFGKDEVKELLRPEKIRQVMTETFSDSKRTISFYIKWVFMFLMLSKHKEENISDEEMQEMEEEMQEFHEQIDSKFDDLSNYLELLPQDKDVMSIRDYIAKTDQVMEIIEESDIDEEVIRSLPNVRVPEVEAFYDTLENIKEAEKPVDTVSESD